MNFRPDARNEKFNIICFLSHAIDEKQLKEKDNTIAWTDITLPA